MKNIKLSSKILIVKNIKQKNNAYLFEDLHVGSKIKFEVELKRAGKNAGGGTHATYIRCVNLQNNDVACKSFNQIDKILNMFDFEEYSKQE